MNAPPDWDGESHCVEPDCREPATHERICGMVDDVPLVELICCAHARAVTP